MLAFANSFVCTLLVSALFHVVLSEPLLQERQTGSPIGTTVTLECEQV